MKEPDGTQRSEGNGGGERSPVPGGKGASFVLMLWVEPQEGEAHPEWRWRVRHVQTDEQSYFRCLADVLAFVASRSGFPTPR